MVGETATRPPSMPPTTTAQQDLVAEGQRHINVKWETTQQIIAILITAAAVTVCGEILFMGEESLRQAAFIFLTNIAFLVIGTYFQRTNHTKTGGVGSNEIVR